MIRNLTPEKARELMTQGDVDIVDVRDPSEWSTGHLPGARLLPLAELRANPKASLPRDGVILVCASGMRSETAARVAAGLGLQNVYNLSGGTRAWVKAGLPVEQELRVAV